LFLVTAAGVLLSESNQQSLVQDPLGNYSCLT